MEQRNKVKHAYSGRPILASLTVEIAKKNCPYCSHMEDAVILLALIYSVTVIYILSARQGIANARAEGGNATGGTASQSQVPNNFESTRVW